MLNTVKRPSRLNRKIPVGIGNFEVVVDFEKNRVSGKGKNKVKYM